MIKKWFILLLLGCLLLISQSAFAFQDIKGDPAEAKIQALQQAGIISGVNEDSFAPNGKVTYAQGIHLLVKGLDLNLDRIRFIKEPKASDSYSNVKDDAWYASSMITAFYNGIPVERDIKPDLPMTRETFAYYLYSGLVGKAEFITNKMYLIIHDEKDINAAYMNAIQDLIKLKIAGLQDGGNFKPKAEITRSEAAEMVFNAREVIKQYSTNDPQKVPPGEPKGEAAFTKEPVNQDVNKVTLTWGSKPNAGYRVQINRLDFTQDGKAIISYSLLLPDKDKMYAQVITEPKAMTYVASHYEIVLKQE
jgi:hypothetical protein